MAQRSSIEASRRFYEERAARMIKVKFPQYESRIAAGIAGEGSECFGYDDFMSRDHDFGTGVCLWLTDGDMQKFGAELKSAYDELYDNFVKEHPESGLTERLRERRGVMTIHDYYSNILGIDCDTQNCVISDNEWQAMDHNCIATAVNGEVFRDDQGVFTAFRNLLLKYYPDHIWKIRIANELHRFSAAMQVNYARCMSRGDVVAARICQTEGLESAMQLYFLMKREYPPYYKWTFRRLEEIDRSESGNKYSKLIRAFSELNCDLGSWAGKTYSPDTLNTEDPMIKITEKIAARIVAMLKSRGFTRRSDPYLERYVDEVLNI
ncbi:MAG: DUF4037 domain-containing protein [Lachnospiraceae bacterium]|nr:DUF4037 domain-containing protein [Lachnospiraceae bacterium]